MAPSFPARIRSPTNRARSQVASADPGSRSHQVDVAGSKARPWSSSSRKGARPEKVLLTAEVNDVRHPIVDIPGGRLVDRMPLAARHPFEDLVEDVQAERPVARPDCLGGNEARACPSPIGRIEGELVRTAQADEDELIARPQERVTGGPRPLEQRQHPPPIAIWVVGREGAPTVTEDPSIARPNGEVEVPVDDERVRDLPPRVGGRIVRGGNARARWVVALGVHLIPYRDQHLPAGPYGSRLDQVDGRRAHRAPCPCGGVVADARGSRALDNVQLPALARSSEPVHIGLLPAGRPGWRRDRHRLDQKRPGDVLIAGRGRRQRWGARMVGSTRELRRDGRAGPGERRCAA